MILEFKKWLNEKLILENIQGEYWIQDGYAIGADGDINDFNHEGYAIMSAQSSIVDDAVQQGYVDNEYLYNDYGVDWDEFQKNLMKGFVEQYPNYEDMMDNEPDKLLNVIWKDLGVNSEILQIANDYGDVRTLAMKLWGWKAARGNHIQTWTFTKEDISSILQGMDEMIPYGNDKDFEVEIEVMSNKQLYQVPYSVLKSGDPIKVANWGREKLNTQKQNSYNNAFKQLDKPQNSFYKRFGD